jgi:four helix bundle protein
VNYRDLLVWQKGMALVVRVYDVTRMFPLDERFDLISQMCRAAVSIPSNIAEGPASLHAMMRRLHTIRRAPGLPCPG